MGYASNPCGNGPPGLEGFWSTVGGGLKTAGRFAVGAVTGVDIGGDSDDEPPPSPILSDRGGAVTGMVVNDRSYLQRLRDRALARLGRDPAVRDAAVSATARYAPPELLAAAAARQARGAPDLMKASVILPVLAVGALLLRRR